MIDLFIIPLILSFILVAIHAWFGKGILERGIIFTDLSIAQAAALGSAVSLGYLHGEYLLLLTFSFAFFAGIMIAFAQTRTLHLEAFIGLMYVLSASAIMMVLAHSAEGMEHFKSLLANDILFTTASQLYTSLIVYGSIGAVLILFYPKLTGVFREIIFFTLLALTVTSSVQLVGVLVVFVLLIAPILIATMQYRFSPYRFALGFGWIFSTLSMVMAYNLDLPTGYTMAAVLAIASIVSSITLSQKKV